MTQILKVRFDGTKAAHCTQPVSPELLAKRYHIDENGRRVLVGLTSAETREFRPSMRFRPRTAAAIASPGPLAEIRPPAAKGAGCSSIPSTTRPGRPRAGAASEIVRVGKPPGRANARPMINAACPPLHIAK